MTECWPVALHYLSWSYIITIFV